MQLYLEEIDYNLAFVQLKGLFDSGFVIDMNPQQVEHCRIFFEYALKDWKIFLPTLEWCYDVNDV